MRSIFVSAIAVLVLGIVVLAQATDAPKSKSGSNVVVDLTKRPNWKKNELWTGKSVSDILNASHISKLVLTKAVTSAPANIDGINVLRILESKSVFEEAPKEMRELTTTWEAVLFTKDGKCFFLRIGLEWACLTSQDGHGFFKRRE